MKTCPTCGSILVYGTVDGAFQVWACLTHGIIERVDDVVKDKAGEEVEEAPPPLSIDFSTLADAMVTFRIAEPLSGYVRQTQRSKWVDPRAILYRQYQKKIQWIGMAAGVPRELPRYPGRGILVVKIAWKKQARVDTDNIIKAIADSLWKSDRRCLTVFGDARENQNQEFAEVHVCWSRGGR